MTGEAEEKHSVLDTLSSRRQQLVEKLLQVDQRLSEAPEADFLKLQELRLQVQTTLDQLDGRISKLKNMPQMASSPDPLVSSLSLGALQRELDAKVLPPLEVELPLEPHLLGPEPSKMSAELQEKLVALESQLQASLQALERREQDLDQARQELQVARSQRQQAQGQEARSESEKQIRSVQLECQELMQVVAHKDGEIDLLTSQRIRQQQTLLALESRLRSSQEALLDAQKEVESSQRQLLEERNLVVGQHQLLGQLKAELESLRTPTPDRGEDPLIVELRSQCHRLQSERDSLKGEIQDLSEGLASSFELHQRDLLDREAELLALRRERDNEVLQLRREFQSQLQAKEQQMASLQREVDELSEGLTSSLVDHQQILGQRDRELAQARREFEEAGRKRLLWEREAEQRQLEASQELQQLRREVVELSEGLSTSLSEQQQALTAKEDLEKLVGQLEFERDDLRQRLDTFEGQTSRDTQAWESLNIRFIALQDINHELSSSLKEQEQAYSRERQLRLRLEGEMAGLRQSSESLAQQVQHLDQELEEARALWQTSNRRSEQLRQELDISQQLCISQQEQWEELERRHRSNLVETQELAESLVERDLEIHSLGQRLQSLEKELAESRGEFCELQGRLALSTGVLEEQLRQRQQHFQSSQEESQHLAEALVQEQEATASLRAQLAKLEQALFQKEQAFSSSQQQLQALEQSQHSLQESQRHTQALLQESLEELGRLRQEVVNTQQALEAAQEELLSREQLLGQRDEQIVELQAHLEQVEGDQRELHLETGMTRQRLQFVEAKLSESQGLLTQRETELAQIQGERAALADRLEQQRSELEETQVRLVTTRAQLEQQAQAMQDKVDGLLEKAVQKSDELMALRRELEASQALAAILQQECDSSRGTLEVLQQKSAQIQAEALEVVELLAQKDLELNQLQAGHALLQAESQGIFEQQLQLSSAHDELQGILREKEQQLEIAVERLAELEKALQFSWARAQAAEGELANTAQSLGEVTSQGELLRHEMVDLNRQVQVLHVQLESALEAKRRLAASLELKEKDTSHWQQEFDQVSQALKRKEQANQQQQLRLAKALARIEALERGQP